VVVGAEHVSYSAALTLRDAGATVVMTTPAERHDTFAAFALGMRALRVPLRRHTVVTRIRGRGRVEAVELGDGSSIECDTVVFTGDWVADDELARTRGIEIGSGTTTTQAGFFAVGNVRLLGKRADQCVRDAQAAADNVTGWLDEGPA
jgi:thioredoxin reductase